MAERELVGKVSFYNRGTYNNSTSYTKLDVVRYNGQSFIAKQSTRGHAPSGGNSDNYWQLLSSTGSYTPTLVNGILT